MSKDKNSDSDKNIDLFQHLPDVFGSDTNRAVFSNLFNRFLTKNETTQVAGYIGQGNPNAIIKRQIKEETVHRQSFQLQPLLYSKIGTTEYINSWYDILSELERQGINIDRLPQWGDALKFNWVPPIDIDKIINFRDYYWVDQQNPASQPQYITVRGECSTATSKVNFYQSLIKTHGTTFKILSVNPSQASIQISGNFEQLFDFGFVLFIRNSLNLDLNNSFHTVESSSFNLDTNTTTIVLQMPFTSNIADGEISQEEQLYIARAIRDCRCLGTSGFDSQQFDDNQINVPPPIGNAALIPIIRFATLSEWNSVNLTPQLFDIWWNTTDDSLYTLQNIAAPNNIISWKQIIGGFSQIVNQTTGTAYWDATLGCERSATILGLEQWISQNKWFHKADVINFSIAKQAAAPILEFEPNLELNEWTLTTYKWKYRKSSTHQFIATSLIPSRFELEPINQYTVNGSTLLLDAKYGDLTEIFVPGFKFLISGSSEQWEVINSTFNRNITGRLATTITTTAPVPVIPTHLYPIKTSVGDTWRQYNDHWLFDGIKQTTAVNHQPENNEMDLSNETLIIGGNFDYRLAQYGQQFVVKAATLQQFILDVSLQEKSLIGFDDIRVYVNNIRQYGTYNEQSSIDVGVGTDNKFVAAIAFFTPIVAGSVVTIQVGEAAISDFGNSIVYVRTIEDNIDFGLTGAQPISLVKFKKNEQIKKDINQYPLFDLYNTNATSNYQATPIFKYHEGPNATLYSVLQRRVFNNEQDGTIEFENTLIDQTEKMFAYRNYDKSTSRYWFDTKNNIVKIWTGTTWSTKYETSSGYYLAPRVQRVEPTGSDLDDMIVFSTEQNKLYQYNLTLDTWEEIDVLIYDTDETLETIWRKGLNNEKYIPKKVDWNRRSYVQFEQEHEQYVDQRIMELRIENPALTEIEAEELAEEKWTQKQLQEINPAWYEDLSAERIGPHWVGNWEIPDPFYYNPSHENRKHISYRQLVAHFISIINAQIKIPGYSGLKSAMFRLLDFNQINYGLGGTIREYNNGFDTFLSATYINTLTPPSLLRFAQTQYDNAIIILHEAFRRNAVNLMTSFEPQAIINLQKYVNDQIIKQYEQNAAAGRVFGDSTAYQEGINGQLDKGVRNWIATLPFFRILDKFQPHILIDDKLSINKIFHHDGHYTQYSIPSTVIRTLQQQIINTPDIRTIDTTGVAQETIGRASLLPPPATHGDFLSQFSLTPRLACYWLTTSPEQILYRLSVSSIGTTEPSVLLEDGSLWWDTTPGAVTLRIKAGLNWNVVPGLVVGDGKLFNGTSVQTSTVSAWDVINLNEYLLAVIHEVEYRLFKFAPMPSNLVINIDNIEHSNLILFDQYMREAFNDYVRRTEIISPFANNTFTPLNPFTWNYTYSTISLLPSPTNTGDERGGDWRDLYQKFFKTPYPHLEPWVLQGYNNKPDWWDETYVNDNPLIYGLRRWKQLSGDPNGMWARIIAGVIPVGKLLPSGYISTGMAGEGIIYNYVPVNISDNTVAGYYPDDLLPPYFEEQNGIRSLISSLSDVNNEYSDYVWKDVGPVEWIWRNSSTFLYDRVIAAYRIDPIRVLQSIFGIEYNNINGLLIEKETGKVFSHKTTQFHGELTLDNQPVKINGINQWYINYNRSGGIDTNYSDFRTLWTRWISPLSYQFGGVIDTSSFFIDHRQLEITPGDYNITMKRSPGVENYWIDAFNARIVQAPANLAAFDTKSLWQIELDTLSPITREIKYYNVKVYDFYLDTTTNICSLFTYPIEQVILTTNAFVVYGDCARVFIEAKQLQVTGSSTNNGTYDVVTAIYNYNSKTTIIIVEQSIVSSISDGVIIALNNKILPWNTGDLVILDTTELLPRPFDLDRQYFLIKVSPTQFKLAFTLQDAIAGISIVIEAPGHGIHQVGQLHNSFVALNGQTTTTRWRHYELDKLSLPQKFTPPFMFTGMQELINIIDGYAAYQYDIGFRINDNSAYIDPQTRQLVSWNIELERFIDWAYQQRIIRRQRQADKYSVQLDDITNTFSFTSQTPTWLTGDQVIVWSFEGGLPTPLQRNEIYFVIQNGNNIQLATTKLNARQGIAIDLQSIPSMGQLFLSQNQQYQIELPTFEINPIRNAIWFAPRIGVVSNIIVGPHEDIRSHQLIFDQHGRRISPSNIRVFRQDKLTYIQFSQGVFNDVNHRIINTTNPYTHLHFGGANIFVDTFEHVLLFNNTTTGGALLFDPFLGLNVTKFELDFYKQKQFTQRPNVGGYFLSTFYNQGAQFLRNIEGSINDIRYFYDTYTIPETLLPIKYARELIGYEGIKDYLTDINLTPKTQFLFYRGLIQSKGSINAIKAFINSRRFIDAKVDEYWAVKIAEFGSSFQKEYASIYLTAEDTITNDLRLEFLPDSQICTPGFEIEAFGDSTCGYANPESVEAIVFNVDTGFTPVPMSDQTRWFEQPNQSQVLRDQGRSLFFTLKPIHKLEIFIRDLGDGLFNPYDETPEDVMNDTDPLHPINLTGEQAVIVRNTGVVIPIQPNPATDYSFWIYNVENKRWVFSGGWNTNDPPVLRHNFKADKTIVTFDWYPNSLYKKYTGIVGNELTIDPYLPLTNSIEVFIDDRPAVIATDYVESLIPVSGSLVLTDKLHFAEDLTGKRIEVVYKSATLLESTHFELINSNIIRLLSSEFIDQLIIGSKMILWGLLTDKESQNPAKVIDTKSNVVLAPVIFWDPARGHHYYRAYHAIDLIRSTDPALYSPLIGWKSLRVGITWLDSSTLYYQPYYDKIVMQTAEQQFGAWGQLADFSQVKLYQWTESDVPPEEWDRIAFEEQSDISIDVRERKSGTTRKETRFRTRDHFTTTITPATSAIIDILISTNKIYPTDLTLLGTGPSSPLSYSFNIVLTGGINRTIIIQTEEVETYQELINAINDQMQQYGVIAELINVGTSGYIRFSTIELGSTITLRVYDQDLFVSLTGSTFDQSSNGTDTEFITTVPHTFVVGDQILVSGSLPTGLIIGTLYTIIAASATTFKLQNVVITTGQQNVIAAAVTWTDEWELDTTQVVTFDSIIEGIPVGVSYEFKISPTMFKSGTIVDIYKNGKLYQSKHVLSGQGPWTIIVEAKEFDTIEVVKPQHIVTEEDRQFNPEINDDGTRHIQYQELTNFIAVPFINQATNLVEFKYYFWVENKTTVTGNKTSISTAVKELITPAEPYMFFAKLVDGSTIELPETTEIVQVPDRFVQAIIRGLRGYVDDERRYIVRFTRDYTLRDRLNFGNTPLALKNVHKEWQLFRKEQHTSIPRWLWNKVIESIIGYTLLTPTIRIPSLERELYDQQNQTDTRYGLEEGQAFVSGNLALATILDYLNRPGIDFYPIDIDTFFEQYAFDTPEQIIEAMNVIYNTFNYIHVNAIFFEVLHDALSTKSKYVDLMKTSMISLHGIKLLEVQGIFDD